MTVNLVSERNTSSRWVFGIDRGGTFTDIVAWCPDGSVKTHKVLSEAAGSREDAAVIGIRSILGLQPNQPIPAEQIDVVRMGTTVGTNALLERRGEPVVLVVTRGFRDVIRIGYQNRPRLFDLNIVLPDVLYSAVVEVGERIGPGGEMLLPLDAAPLEIELRQHYSAGFRSCAIACMHGYRYSKHEKEIARIARAIGFMHVSTSHECSGLIKFISRAETAVVDAYVTPVLRRYVNGVSAAIGHVQLLFMQSNGGLARAEVFSGRDSILSGPAGGVVGAVAVCRGAGFERVIGFDMGGTSTDVWHYAGEFERNAETTIAGVSIRVPMMRIHTVAAGGGSILSFDGQRFRVGPESAGANPGPACYRNGGPLTVTDCNVLLGRLSPAFFPRIFGADGREDLDVEATRRKFDALSANVAAALGVQKTPEECAEGFLRIAVENMANAIKKISVERGYDVTQYTLCSFGGAGGQHACRVAEALGISKVFVHPLAGVLSAYGMGLADLRVVEEESVEERLVRSALDGVEARYCRLGAAAVRRLIEQNIPEANIAVSRRAVLRYEGSNVGLNVPFVDAETASTAFVNAYRLGYGFTIPDKPLVVESLVVEAVGALGSVTQNASSVLSVTYVPPMGSTTEMYVNGETKTVPVYRREHIAPGHRIIGPAIVIDPTATTVVELSWQATVQTDGTLVMERASGKRSSVGLQMDVDPIYLELFNNRFMAIAEQMGQALINTAHSVNIKERLDFSCALFDGDTNLIANAPHIPIHLGAMSESVLAISRDNDGQMQPGDIFVLNSPYRGGAHLPDVTVVMPVFDREGRRILFYTAARGHHADIGGTTPGSMPPDSTNILEEGVLIEGTRLIEGGAFLEGKLRNLLASARYPARNPEQNLADLRAQAAACVRGSVELGQLVEEFGESVVLAYSQHIQDAAEAEVRRVIARLSDGWFRCEHDQGFGVEVMISVDRSKRSAVIDFTATSAQVPGNFNAPPAITRSAVLYVFRTLVGGDIPLNAGCLRPLKIVIPAGTMLNPRFPAAVAAGNPETSVLVTDTLYGALGILGSSQGTMNNLTFGNERYQYYETICGGAGAGNGFDGASAVHTHMTNSRMTDPEILELRFPVLVKDFRIRIGSGGAGRYRGGDGTTRKLHFLEEMTFAIMSNRRRVPPFGAAGGGAGGLGRNRIIRADGGEEELNGCDRATVRMGDCVVIDTPGGGGYGEPAVHAMEAGHEAVSLPG